MKNISLKIAVLILTILALTLTLTSCGGKTSAKAVKANKVKKAQSADNSGAAPAQNQTEQQKFTSKLNLTESEMNDVVSEIDAAMNDIDGIDGSQDNVPNL